MRRENIRLLGIAEETRLRADREVVVVTAELVQVVRGIDRAGGVDTEHGVGSRVGSSQIVGAAGCDLQRSRGGRRVRVPLIVAATGAGRAAAQEAHDRSLADRSGVDAKIVLGQEFDLQEERLQRA